MKKLLLGLFLLTPSIVFAGLPPTSAKGQSESTAATTFFFQTPNNQLTTTAGVTRLIETGNGNVLLNPGFEHSTATTSWTATTASGASETSNIRQGAKSYALTFSASTGNVAQSVTPTWDVGGMSLEATCDVKTALITIQVCSLIAGSEVQCVDVAGDSVWHTVSASAIGITSSSVGVDVKTSASTTGTVYVDNCYVGPNRNIGSIVSDTGWVINTGFTYAAITASENNVSIRQVGGTLFVKGNFSVTGAGSASDFSIILPTGYVIDSSKMTASKTKVLGTITRAPNAGSALAGAASGPWPLFYDGSTTDRVFMAGNASSNTLAKDDGAFFDAASQRGFFEFEVPVVGGASTPVVRAESGNTSWMAYTPTFTGLGTVTSINVFSRRQGDTLQIRGTFSTGTATAATASLTLGFNGVNSNVALDTTKVASGISHTGQWASGSGSGTGNYQNNVLVDSAATGVLKFGYQNGSTNGLTAQLGNAAFANSTGYSFFAEVPISGWSTNSNAIMIPGSVFSNSTGTERIERAKVTCSSSSSVSSQSGSWLTSIGNISSGACAGVMTTGNFSAAPTCTATPAAAYSGNVVSGEMTVSSATAFSLGCRIDPGGSSANANCTNVDFNILCIGPR